MPNKQQMTKIVMVWSSQHLRPCIVVIEHPRFVELVSTQANLDALIGSFRRHAALPPEVESEELEHAPSICKFRIVGNDAMRVMITHRFFEKPGATANE